MKKHHPYTHTHVEHHEDGSHTIHHVHKDGPHKDVKSAAGSHDEMLDHLMDHTSAPNEGEDKDEANVALAGAAPAAAAPVVQGA